jgi:hypothetical protein
MKTITMMRAIGWGSLAFTVGSLVAPRALGSALGHRGRTAPVRMIGARDLVIGAGLVAAADPEPWLRRGWRRRSATPFSTRPVPRTGASIEGGP